MKKVKSLIQKRDGTTLVEMIVTLLLISIMLAMATASLSSATRIFIRMQKLQQAQIVTDNIMTELQAIAREATGYVKIYEDGEHIVEKKKKNSGQAIEFFNTKDYEVLVSTQGCEKTDIMINEEKNGESEAVKSGRLLTRYYRYFNEDSDGNANNPNQPAKRYYYETNNHPVARAVAPVFGDGYYMGNYLKVTYEFPKKIVNGSEEDTQQNDRIKSVTATVSLCSDEACQNVIATQTGILEFRYKVVRWNDKTAESKIGSQK